MVGPAQNSSTTTAIVNRYFGIEAYSSQNNLVHSGADS